MLSFVSEKLLCKKGHGKGRNIFKWLASCGKLGRLLGHSTRPLPYKLCGHYGVSVELLLHSAAMQHHCASWTPFTAFAVQRAKPLQLKVSSTFQQAPSRKLDADDFRHPLDRQNTAILRVIPGITEIGKLLLGPAAEQVMLLENISTSVKVNENQLPDIHKLIVNASKILGLDSVPDLYIRQNPSPNAYTLAITGRKPFIVIHTSIVELLTPSELQAVLAHELGHLKCDHGIWLTFANILALGAYSLPGLGAVVARNVEEQLFRWLRAAELTCDRAALLVVEDPNVVMSLLMKLAGGCPSLADKLNADEFLKQARSYDEASASPLGWFLRNAQTRQLSHPLPVLRAREIDEWARSNEFKSLVTRIRCST